MRPQQRTSWFPASVNPAHVGWYEIRWADSAPPEIEKQFWFGEKLGWFYVTPQAIGPSVLTFTASVTGMGEIAGDQWRGLKVQP